MEAWDGPAGLVIQDGRYAVLCLTAMVYVHHVGWLPKWLYHRGFRNRYLGYQPEDVIAKGRVGPGQMLVIDTETGNIMDTKAVGRQLKKPTHIAYGYGKMRYVYGMMNS